jgi:hypothetical protein
MKYIFTLTAVLFTVSVISGCSEELPEEYDRIVSSTLLNFTWTTDCIADGEDSYIPTLSFTSDGGENYDSGTATSSNIYYRGSTTCVSSVIETLDISSFSYRLGDYVIVDGTVGELTQAMQIDTVNTTEGSTDIGAEEYDIFAVKDKYTLYFGDKTDPTNGTTADLRPTQLTDDIIYTR